MLKWIISVLCLLFLSTPIFAQQPNIPPVIYRIVNRGNETPTGDQLSIIDALTQQQINRIDLPAAVNLLEFTADKNRVFTVGTELVTTRGAYVIDFSSASVVKQLFPGILVYTVRLAPDGSMWLVLGDNNQIAIVNPQTLQTISRVENIDKPRDVVFSPDGNGAYISLEDNRIVFLDVARKQVISTINTNLPQGLRATPRPKELAITSDGKLLSLASKNDVILVDTSSLKIVDSFTFQNRAFLGFVKIQFSPNDKILYVSEDGGFNLFAYELAAKKFSTVFVSPVATIQDFDLSEDGRLIYISDFGGRYIVDSKTLETLFAVDEFNTRVQNSQDIALRGNFNIGQAPTIQTLSPAAGQQLIPGQTITVKWNTTVAPQSFSISSHKLELSTDGGITFSQIPNAETIRSAFNEFTWQVPDIEVINKAQIRVSAVDLGARRSSASTGNFSISRNMIPPADTQAPTVTFLSPKGAERFNSGDNLQISWVSSDNVGVTSQDLSLSTDGGATFPVTIASGLSGTTQSFSFPIPSTLQTNQARIRLVVRDGASNSAQAITQANFSIESAADTTAPIVTISQPTANQSLIAGQPIQVNWQSTDNKAVVSQGLLLSLDGGKTFATVANFGASDNSFVIRNIEELNVTNSQGIVRITATDSSGNIGQANVQFSISPAITNVTYQAKILTLMGIGFLSNSTSSTTKLFVNDKEITLKPISVSNNSFTIKGNKKKLGGIVRGNNTVRLVVNGVSSNTLTFTF